MSTVYKMLIDGIGERRYSSEFDSYLQSFDEKVVLVQGSWLRGLHESTFKTKFTDFYKSVDAVFCVDSCKPLSQDPGTANNFQHLVQVDLNSSEQKNNINSKSVGRRVFTNNANLYSTEDWFLKTGSEQTSVKIKMKTSCFMQQISSFGIINPGYALILRYFDS